MAYIHDQPHDATCLATERVPGRRGALLAAGYRSVVPLLLAVVLVLSACTSGDDGQGIDAGGGPDGPTASDDGAESSASGNQSGSDEGSSGFRFDDDSGASGLGGTEGSGGTGGSGGTEGPGDTGGAGSGGGENGNNRNDAGEAETAEYQQIRLTYDGLGGGSRVVSQGDRVVETTSLWEPESMNLSLSSQPSSPFTVKTSASAPGVSCTATKNDESVTLQWKFSDIPDSPGETCTATFTFDAVEDKAITSVQFRVLAEAIRVDWTARIEPAPGSGKCFQPGERVGTLVIEGYLRHRVSASDGLWVKELDDGSRATFSVGVYDEAAFGQETISIKPPTDHRIYFGSGKALPSITICGQPDDNQPVGQGDNGQTAGGDGVGDDGTGDDGGDTGFDSGDGTDPDDGNGPDQDVTDPGGGAGTDEPGGGVDPPEEGDTQVDPEPGSEGDPDDGSGSSGEGG